MQHPICNEKFSICAAFFINVSSTVDRSRIEQTDVKEDGSKSD